MNAFDRGDLDRLVIRLPNPVGDVVACTPLLRRLREALPTTRLLGLGSAAARELLGGLDSLDELHELAGPARGWARVRQEARALRALAPDAVLLLPNSFSSALAARLARVRVRVGRTGSGRAILLTHRLPQVGEARAMTELYRELGEPFGVADGGSEGEAPIELVVEETALSEAAVTPSEPWIAVAPGAAFGPSKVYPPEMLGAALRSIESELGLRPVLLGPPSEADLAAEVRAVHDAPFLPCGLAEMKALLARAEVLLCMDSGARHIAAALGVPQVVLYGSTDPRWTSFALDRTVRLRREDLDCSPCHLPECPIDHPCLRGISAGEIVDAVRRATARSVTKNGTRARAGPV